MKRRNIYTRKNGPREKNNGDVVFSVYFFVIGAAAVVVSHHAESLLFLPLPLACWLAANAAADILMTTSKCSAVEAKRPPPIFILRPLKLSKLLKSALNNRKKCICVVNGLYFGSIFHATDSEHREIESPDHGTKWARGRIRSTEKTSQLARPNSFDTNGLPSYLIVHFYGGLTLHTQLNICDIFLIDCHFHDVFLDQTIIIIR